MFGFIKIGLLIVFISIMLLIYFFLLKSELKKVKKSFEDELKKIRFSEDSIKLREKID